MYGGRGGDDCLLDTDLVHCLFVAATCILYIYVF